MVLRTLFFWVFPLPFELQCFEGGLIAENQLQMELKEQHYCD
jgi:hypothetical protein